MKLVEHLRKPYGVIVGCTLLSGVVVGTLEDARHWLISRFFALLPAQNEQTACIEGYLRDREAKNTGQYRVVLTQIANDGDLSQTALMDRSLRRLYGEDLNGAIQLETVDCALFAKAGNAAERVKASALLAATLATEVDADVVIWGEVVSSDQLINLRLSHVQGTGSKDYAVNEGVVGTDFGTDIASIFAAKVLTSATVNTEEEGRYLGPRMRRVLKLTAPLIEKLPPGISADDLGSLWHAYGDANYRLGSESGNSTQLTEAVAAYRVALGERTRERVPLDWATTQNNLGNALWRLGQHERGTALLQEAVVAHRAALQERTRARVPLDWAATQNNLGNALRTLAERENSTAELEESVIAFRSALEEYTRERSPLNWAMTQNNLGNALWQLGERKTGTAELEESVVAYRSALEEYTRERVPLDWAMTQNNLGNALAVLGTRDEGGTAQLEEAAVAYRAALEEYTRERVPLEWATTQNNLGNVLRRLGQRKKEPARLEEAVIAYRAALKERTRERVPLSWAKTQNNLGNVLWDLGKNERETARLEEAAAAYRAALEELTHEVAPDTNDMLLQNLILIKALLEERRKP